MAKYDKVIEKLKTLINDINYVLDKKFIICHVINMLRIEEGLQDCYENILSYMQLTDNNITLSNEERIQYNDAKRKLEVINAYQTRLTHYYIRFNIIVSIIFGVISVVLSLVALLR